MEEEGKLITKEDLYTAPETMWSNSEKLEQLEKEMNILEKLRYSEEFPPDEVVSDCITEVLMQAGWYDFNSFREVTNKIVMYGPQSVPLSVRVKDHYTKQNDFWLLKVLIDLTKNDTIIHKGVEYKKLDIIMSKKFCSTLKNYCRNKLNDQVQFWCFSGSYSGKQQLDMTKFSEQDLEYVMNKYGHTDPSKFVMIQFKKKNPEIFIHTGDTPADQKGTRVMTYTDTDPMPGKARFVSVRTL